MPTDLFGALTTYCAGLSAANGKATYGFQALRLFARIFREDYGSRSVVAFVGLASGDMYHARSWKSAGHRTGHNVFNVADGFTKILSGVKP